MHGLIFETSIWLLAGSTRYLTGSSESENNNSLDPEAISRQKVRKLPRRPPQSQETFTSETEPCAFHNFNNFHAVQFVGCQVQCVKSASELAPHFGPKKAGIRSKISKKVRYHLQSFELGLRKTNENKKPPRTGRFFINSAHADRKTTPRAVQSRKNPWGANCIKKHTGESGGSETLAPKHRPDVRHTWNRSSQGDSAKTIRTEPNAADWTPVVQTVGERLNFNFFLFLCFTRTTSWTRRLDRACCIKTVYSVRFEPNKPFRQDQSRRFDDGFWKFDETKNFKFCCFFGDKQRP